MTSSPRELTRAGLVLACCWVLASAYVVYLYFAPNHRILGFIPDDAFFYPEIARHLLRGQPPSIDGLSPTNGYHPLWLALIFGPTAIYSAGYLHLLLFQVALHYTGLFVLTAALRRLAPWVSSVVFALLAGTFPPVLISGYTLLETSALLLVLALNVYYLVTSDFRTSRTFLIQGALMGLLFLARTDSIFLMPPLAAIALTKSGWTRATLKRAVPGVIAGSVLAGPWLLYNKIAFGSFVQGSGKLFYLYERRYLEFHHHLELLPVRQLRYLGAVVIHLVDAILGVPWWLVYGVIGLALATLALGWRRRPGAASLLFGLCGGLFYIGCLDLAGAYRMAWREWYSMPLMIVTLVSATTVISVMTAVPRRRMALGIVIAGALGFVDRGPLLHGMWPLQVTAPEGFRQLSTMVPQGERVAMTDAGMSNWFDRFPVTNLDGIINAEALDAAGRGALFSYLQRHQIDYFVAGRMWWNRTWLMGEGTGLQYAHLGYGLHRVLHSNDEIVKSYWRPTIDLTNPLFEKYLGLGWCYPIPDVGNPEADGAWWNTSYLSTPSPDFVARGVWSDGPESHLFLPLRAGERFHVRLTLKVLPRLSGGVSVKVSDGAQVLVSQQLLPAEPQTLEFDVVAAPSSLLTTLTLEYDLINRPRQPANGRALPERAVAITRIDLTPQN